MVWERGGGRNFFRVEGQVREHSCLPAQVFTLYQYEFMDYKPTKYKSHSHTAYNMWQTEKEYRVQYFLLSQQ